jgi:hypothetical protein
MRRISVLAAAAALPLALLTNAPPANACTPAGSSRCSTPAILEFLSVAHSLGITGSTYSDNRFLDLSQQDANIVYAGSALCYALRNLTNMFSWNTVYAQLGVNPSPSQLTALVDSARTTICVDYFPD